jgi:hypothetical protein
VSRFYAIGACHYDAPLSKPPRTAVQKHIAGQQPHLNTKPQGPARHGHEGTEGRTRWRLISGNPWVLHTNSTGLCHRLAKLALNRLSSTGQGSLLERFGFSIISVILRECRPPVGLPLEATCPPEHMPSLGLQHASRWSSRGPNGQNCER